jgi:membrane-bound lytic murein transglycosylase B
MKKILAPLLLSSALFANYTDCSFQNPDYTTVCEKVVKKGVSYEYANKFLLSYFKTKKYDERSWALLQPKKLKMHSKNEKRANNVLVKFLPKLVTHLKEYRDIYDYTEKKYGVNREVVAAILLKETRLGKYKPKHDAFIVFNTMLLRSDRSSARQRWLKKLSIANMSAIIDFCYKNNTQPNECNLPSSYAGAVGIPQFMPESFTYAKSTSDKMPDLTTMQDAILSASYFLHKKAKWEKLIDYSKIPDMTKIESAWYEYDFTHKNASFAYERSSNGKKRYNCFSCNKPELLYTKEYILKIMRYNNSSNYAVGVLSLAYRAHQILKEE